MWDDRTYICSPHKAITQDIQQNTYLYFWKVFFNEHWNGYSSSVCIKDRKLIQFFRWYSIQWNSINLYSGTKILYAHSLKNLEIRSSNIMHWGATYIFDYSRIEGVPMGAEHEAQTFKNMNKLSHWNRKEHPLEFVCPVFRRSLFSGMSDPIICKMKAKQNARSTTVIAYRGYLGTWKRDSIADSIAGDILTLSYHILYCTLECYG